ncbi:MAG: hypothetical protein CSA42_01015 [Gammaproteobacteria bacterium]|nr:MAG: hypothetical protein CSA42_01015 [Gammaproteobacteria bacterium]
MDLLQTFGLLDILFIVILAISIIVGLIRGAIREILSLVGLGLAVYLAFNFSEMLSKNYVSQLFEQPRVSYIVTFILIIVITIFAVALINLLISQLLKASGLSAFNRFLGMLFGILRGAVICCIITLMLSLIPGVKNNDWWKASVGIPIFQQISDITKQYIPKNILDSLNSTGESISQVANNAITNAVRPNGNKDAKNQATKNTTQKILQSIDDSNKEADNPVIELESYNATDDADKNDKKQLELEPYQ